MANSTKSAGDSPIRLYASDTHVHIWHTRMVQNNRPQCVVVEVCCIEGSILYAVANSIELVQHIVSLGVGHEWWSLNKKGRVSISMSPPSFSTDLTGFARLKQGPNGCLSSPSGQDFMIMGGAHSYRRGGLGVVNSGIWNRYRRGYGRG